MICKFPVCNSFAFLVCHIAPLLTSAMFDFLRRYLRYIFLPSCSLLLFPLSVNIDLFEYFLFSSVFFIPAKRTDLCLRKSRVALPRQMTLPDGTFK